MVNYEQCKSLPNHTSFSNQDNQIASAGVACIHCSTFCNQDVVGFWLILCRKGRYCTVFAREFNQGPIQASTRGVGMVVDFVDANVARGSFLGVILFGARALCTRNDCLYRTCATGPHKSGIIGATAETATVLGSLL